MHSSKLEGYTIEYTDEKEFKILTKEIFKEECYSCDLNTEIPIIIDVGAHIGLGALYFKKEYPNASVVCFEPNPILQPILKHNITINGLTDIEVIEKAIDTQIGTRSFYIDTDRTWLSTGSYNPNSWKQTMKTEEIKVETVNIRDVITSCLKLYKVSTIDLLKLDIEGYEYTLIKYLHKKNLLNSISNLIFEYHPALKNNKMHLLELRKLLTTFFKQITFIQKGKTVEWNDLIITDLLIIKCSII